MSRHAKHLGAAYAAQDTLLPCISSASTLVMIEATAYFIYIGTFREIIRPKFVRFCVNVAGSGAQTAEVAVATTPISGNGVAQTLTILEANGTLSALTGTGEHGNTVAFSIVSKGIAPGVHVWAGLRTAMATNEPTVIPAFVNHAARRHFLVVVGAAALATGASLSGTITTFATTTGAPYLYLTQS